MALCATSSYYDTMEIATRILLNIVVLTIDPDSDVRSKAFQAVDQFLQIVKQHEEQINSGDTSGTSSMGMSAGNAGLLGWAMSSLTMKGKADEAPVASAGSSSQLTTTASNASSVMAPPEDTVPTYPAFTADTADLPVPSSPSSTDGWREIENGVFEEEANDGKDKWDDVEPLEEPKPAAFANIQAAQKRPIVQPKSQVTSVKPKSAVRVVKDEDDDLWGSIAAPAPRSTSSTSSNIRASSSASSLNMRASSSKDDDDDPWAAIAAPPPTTRAKPLSLGRGRGTKPAAPKLGAQRVNRTSSGGV